MQPWLSRVANSIWRLSGSAMSALDIYQAAQSILTNYPAGLNAVLPESTLAVWCLCEFNGYYFMV